LRDRDNISRDRISIYFQPDPVTGFALLDLDLISDSSINASRFKTTPRSPSYPKEKDSTEEERTDLIKKEV
jgi:hypothetical protein